MIFKRTLQRESDSSNRTITIEDGALPLKYIVVVYGAGTDIQRFRFGDQFQAIRCAQQKLAESRANGYVISPSRGE
jgi:hypothetical protein